MLGLRASFTHMRVALRELIEVIPRSSELKKLLVSLFALTSLLLTSLPAIAADPCDLANSDVSGCDYSGQDFFNGVLNDKNMSGTNLSSLTSRFSYWERTNLTGANLTGANIYYGDFIDANLTNANLTNAVLTSATLTRADLTGANLTGIISGNIAGIPSAMPAGWKVTAGYIVGPGANLTNANLAGADLTGVSLVGANLSGVRSGGITGNPTLPDKWQLLGGYLFGPGADLSYAKLDGLGIWYLDLTGAKLTGASVVGTNFIYPRSFEGVISGGIVGTLQSGPRIAKGYLIAPKVNLEGADLQGVDLSGLDMEGAFLRGADFTGANLTNVNLASCNAVNTDFTEANLTATNMRSCEIRNTRFNQATMSDTMLGYSQIVGAEFHGSKFLGTEFLFSTLSEIRSSGITGTYFGTAGFIVQDGVIYNRFTQFFIPVIPDELVTGDLLNATIFEAIPAAATNVSYQWLRNGVPIPEATSTFYPVRPVDFGQRLSYTVTIGAPGYLSRSETSFERVVGIGKMTTTAVTITGKAKVGSTVAAVTTEWVDWVTGSKKTYQWLRSGKVIKGATKANYKLTAADKGKKISVKVTQTMKGYSKASRTSTAITVK